MLNEAHVLEEVPRFFRVVALNPFRRTPGVIFDNVPTKGLGGIDAIDRVIHESEATSPGPVDGVERPWYMHTHQDDHLVVLAGIRYVDIYRREYGGTESFEIGPNHVKKGGVIISGGPAMVVWPRGVFHRVRSPAGGSAAVNFAKHHSGMDITANFNIYDLDVETGEFRLVREGWKDQDIQ